MAGREEATVALLVAVVLPNGLEVAVDAARPPIEGFAGVLPIYAYLLVRFKVLIFQKIIRHNLPKSSTFKGPADANGVAAGARVRPVAAVEEAAPNKLAVGAIGAGVVDGAAAKGFAPNKLAVCTVAAGAAVVRVDVAGAGAVPNNAGLGAGVVGLGLAAAGAPPKRLGLD